MAMSKTRRGEGMSRSEVGQGAPLQIVDFRPIPNQNSKLSLNKSALKEFLNSIGNKPIHIISIAGASRQGKSFLLTIIINLLTCYEKGEMDAWEKLIANDKLGAGFQFQNGVDRLTVGFWIWSRPFILKRSDGSEIAVVIMDTQGVFDSFTSEKDWAMIVGLSLLMSSTVIYNLMNNMQEDTLTVLNNFLEFGMLSLQQEGEDMKPPFQKLTFLIRDWNIPQSHPYGASGGSQFLEKKLKINPDTMAKNSVRVRERIKSCFECTDCFLLPHPGEDAIMNDYKGQVSVLDLEFVKHIRSFTEDLLLPDGMQEKMMQGKVMMANELFAYFDKYVTAFNAIKLPDPKTLLEVTIEASLDAAAKTCIANFEDQLQKHFRDEEAYMDVLIIQNLFEELYHAAVKDFEMLTKNVKIEKTKKKHFTIMKNELTSQYNKRINANNKKKDNVTSGALEQAKKAYLATVTEATQAFALLPQQLEEVSKNAIAKAIKDMEAVGGPVMKQFVHELIPKLRLELSQLELSIMEQNQVVIGQQQHNCSELVANLTQEYANLLKIAKLSSGTSFSRTRLQDTHNESEQITLQKLNAQLRTPNPLLQDQTKEALHLNILQILTQQAEEIAEKMDMLEQQAESMLQSSVAQFQQCISNYMETNNSISDIRTQHLLQKALHLNRLNSLYHIFPEKAQFYIEKANEIMDLFYVEIEKTIEANKANIHKKVEQVVQSVAARYSSSLEKEMEEDSFNFEQSFNKITSQLRSEVMDSTHHLSFTKEQEYHDAFKNYMNQEIDVINENLIQSYECKADQENSELRKQIRKTLEEHDSVLKTALSSGKAISLHEFSALHQQEIEKYMPTFENKYHKISPQVKNQMLQEFSNKLNQTFEFLKSKLQNSLQKLADENKTREDHYYKTYVEEMNFRANDIMDESILDREHRDCKRSMERELWSFLKSTNCPQSDRDASMKNLSQKIETDLNKRKAKLQENNQQILSNIAELHTATLSIYCKNSGKLLTLAQNKNELSLQLREEMDQQLDQFEQNFPPAASYASKLRDVERGRIKNDIKTQMKQFLQQFETNSASINKIINNEVAKLKDTYLLLMKRKIGTDNSKKAIILQPQEVQAIHQEVQTQVLKELVNVGGINQTQKETLRQLITAEIGRNFATILGDNDKNLQILQKEACQLLETIKRDLKDKLGSTVNPDAIPEYTKLAEQQADSYLASLPLSDSAKVELTSFFASDAKQISQEWLNETPHGSDLELAIMKAKEQYHEVMKSMTSENKYVHPKILEECHRDASRTVKQKLRIKQIPAVISQLDSVLKLAFRPYRDQNDIRLADLESVAVGIDLGTTYSCVSVFKNGNTEMIPERNSHKYITPSYVLYNGEEILVGQVAKDEAVLYPGKAIFDSKRLIGRKFNEPTTQADINLWPFKVINHNNRPKIQIGKDSYFPEEISSEILIKLKADAEKYLNCEIKNAVITVPAYFSDSQKQATKDAGKVAKLTVLGILNEPTAAAIAYSLSYTDDLERNVVVYDLGGGTFDVSILKIKNGDIEVKAVGGDNHLGGEDFDNKMLDYCLKEFAEKEGIDLREGLPDVVNGRLRRIRHICEKQKIALSMANSTKIVAEGVVGEADLVVEISRDTFNSLNAENFNKTIQVVQSALNEAGLTPEAVDDVVLVGGSTRIPKIQKLLETFFPGKTLNMKLNPDEVVARGAAVYAAMLSGSNARELGKINLSDVAPLSLGIETIGNKFSKIIPKNTKVPVTKTETYYTAQDNQTEVPIKVFEGEDSTATNNNLLGNFVLSGIPLGPAGKEKINVTIEVNKEGILNVSAKIQSTGGSQNVKIESQRNNLSEQELKQLL